MSAHPPHDPQGGQSSHWRSSPAGWGQPGEKFGMKRLFYVKLDFSYGLHLDDSVSDVHSVVLTPALIEHNPHDDARMIFQLINPSQGFIPIRVGSRTIFECQN